MAIKYTILLPHSGPTWNLIWIEFLQVPSCKLGHEVAWLCTCRPPTHPSPDGLLEIWEQDLLVIWKCSKRFLEGVWKVWRVSVWCLKGVWRGSGRLLEAFWINLKFNLLSTLTWDFTMIKMKTFTWNSSVALVSPTCLFFYYLARKIKLHQYLFEVVEDILWFVLNKKRPKQFWVYF